MGRTALPVQLLDEPRGLIQSVGDFALCRHIEAVFKAHRSSCPVGKEWSVANHTALYRSSAEGAERLKFRFTTAVIELLR
jgi:hypothetical protein